MLRDIPKLLSITRAVADAVSLPVTVKTRLGWDCENKIITDLGPRLQDCGIKALKDDPRMEIPVIGNGDITTPEQARDAFDNFGVDGVMIGRASFGAPWIFREVRQMLDTGSFTPLDIDEKFAILHRQIRESVERIDEYRGILHIRRHLASSPLFKGIPDFRSTRIRMLRAETVEELRSILDEARVRVKENSAVESP